MLITFKALNDLAPSYLSSLLSYKSNPRSLRSSKSKNLALPRSSMVKMGDCAFSVYSPTLWNTLPSEIKNSETVNIFKKSLKTYFFNEYIMEN